MWLGLGLGLVALGGGGCLTPDPLAPAVGGQVRAGMTLPEVRGLLGSPTTHEQAPSGRSVETYETVQTIFGSQGVREREEALEIRQFSVRYAPGGRVEETLFHRGVLEGTTMLYSRSLGRDLPPEVLAQVRVGRTTRAELERLLGPPSLARLDLDHGTRLEWIFDRVEAAAVTPARVYRALEVQLDGQGLVAASKAVDRTFPTWRR